jgi:5-methylcytosine-specific restriction endonuclease McrA
MSGKAMGWASADAIRSGIRCTLPFKRRVRTAFELRCQYCGAPEPSNPTLSQLMTVDRVQPGSGGGRYVPSNVTLACRSCNSKKRDREFVGPVRTLSNMEIAP